MAPSFAAALPLLVVACVAAAGGGVSVGVVGLASAAAAPAPAPAAPSSALVLPPGEFVPPEEELCGVGSSVVNASAEAPYSPCAPAGASQVGDVSPRYRCRRRYVPAAPMRPNVVCDADNNAPCTRIEVEAFAEDLRAQLVAAEEAGEAAAFHANVTAGYGRRPVHFWPLLFNVADGEILANGRDALHLGDIAEGALSVGKTLNQWVLDMTQDGCSTLAGDECAEANRRFFVPAVGVPGTDCRSADSPGAGFCVTDDELSLSEKEGTDANTYAQRFKSALNGCPEGSFVYMLMPSSLAGAHGHHSDEEPLDAAEWVFYAAAPTPEGTVVAYGYRNVPLEPVMPCNASFNSLCSIANSVSLVGAALDAVERATTPWEFENALNRITFDRDALTVPGGFYVFSYHFNGANVAHGGSRKNVGRSTEEIVQTVSPALDGREQNALLAEAAARAGGGWVTFLWPTAEDQALIASGELKNASEAAQVPKVAYMQEYEALVRGRWQQFYLGVGYTHTPPPERCTDVWRPELGDPVFSALVCGETENAEDKCSSGFAAPCAVINTLRVIGDVATEVRTHEDPEDFLAEVKTNDRFCIGKKDMPFAPLIIDELNGTLMALPPGYPRNYSTLEELWIDGFGLPSDSYECFMEDLVAVGTSQFASSDTALVGGWTRSPWGVVSNGSIVDVIDHVLYARGLRTGGRGYIALAGFATRSRPEGRVRSFGGRPCGSERATACHFSNARLAVGPLVTQMLASAPDPGSRMGRSLSSQSAAQSGSSCLAAASTPDDADSQSEGGGGTGRHLRAAVNSSVLPLLNDTFAKLTEGEVLAGTPFEDARIYVLRTDASQTRACVVASTIRRDHVENSTCEPVASMRLGPIRPDGEGDERAWVEAHYEAANSREYEENFLSGYANVMVSNASGDAELLRVYVMRVRAGADGETYLVATGVPYAPFGSEDFVRVAPFAACGVGCPDHSSCSSTEQEFCACDEGYEPSIVPTGVNRSLLQTCVMLERDDSSSFPTWAIGVIAGLGATAMLGILLAAYRRRQLKRRYESAWVIDPSEVTPVLERGEVVPLGAGTFGTVYLGRFRGTLVALKRVSLYSSARTVTASTIAPLSENESSVKSVSPPPSLVDAQDSKRQQNGTQNGSAAMQKRVRSRMMANDSALSISRSGECSTASASSPAAFESEPEGSTAAMPNGCSTRSVDVGGKLTAASSQLPTVLGVADADANGSGSGCVPTVVGVADADADGSGSGCGLGSSTSRGSGSGSVGSRSGGDIGCVKRAHFGSCVSLGCLSIGSGTGSQSGNLGLGCGGTAASGTGAGKRLSSARLANIFKREIRLMVRLRHPNIVTVLGATKEADPLLVLEYMPRGTLRDLLLNPTADLPASLLIGMVRDVVCGMRYLHSGKEPIIHGDIKAANVLVNDSFDCKLSDFGLSSTKGRMLGAGRRSAVGTPFWMAPELLAGESNSEASDVYGLGMLCWECFARDVPYADHKGKSTRDILLEVRSDETKLRPTISAEMRRSAPTGVVQLIEDCLLHNPDRRPSLEEIDAALDRMQSSGGTNRTPLRKADLFDPAANTRRSMLLDRMLPPDVAARLTRGEKVGALRYEHATIFFCDIVNFTEIGDQLGDPEDVAAMLDRLYSRFDSLVREFGVFKLETIGDCYMVAGGVAREQPRTHAARVAAFALAAIDEAAATLVCERRPELGTLRIRAGAHVGPVVGGLVGSDKLKFSVYGDTVNTASRCESNSEAQTLTTTDAGAAALREQAPWLLLERKGKVEVKGKGNLVLWRVRRGGGSEADSANGDGDAATDDLRAHLDELDALDDADAEDKDDTSSSDRALEKKRSSVELRDVAVESPP